MNKVMVIGNLTKDPEHKLLESGKSVCSFTVAVNRKVSSDGETDFFRVTTWDKLADNCVSYLSKGRKVCVVGSIRANAYINQDGEARASLEINAQEVHFLGVGKAQNEEHMQST